MSKLSITSPPAPSAAEAIPPTGSVSFAEPLRLGNLTLEHRVLPAPMCGISDRPTRFLARDMGVNMAYTQMFNSEGVIRGDRHTWDLIDIDGEGETEGPVAVQLFGGNPTSLGEAARVLQDRGAALVDLNMGCPARKVTSNMCGSALMKEPTLVRDIVKSMRAGCNNVPMTAKFRAGWDEGVKNMLEIGHICQEEGADAVALHPRTREQKYTGHADWDLIAELKSHLKIPVIGNGDIVTPEDAMRMFLTTGCDAVMLGRGWLGNPWVLRDCIDAVHHPERDAARRAMPIREDREGVKSPHVPLEERLRMLLLHGELMARWKGERRGMIELRKHGVQYIKGLSKAKSFKQAFIGMDTLAGLRQLVERMLEEIARFGSDDDDAPGTTAPAAAPETP